MSDMAIKVKESAELSLKSALKAGKLSDFISQREAAGANVADEETFDRAVKRAIKPPQSERRTLRSPSRGHFLATCLEGANPEIISEPMGQPVILRPAVPAITLDDALLSISTFPNGCDFRLRFEGRRIFLEWGCYGVHVNLVQGAQRALMEWLQSAGRSDRELLPSQIQPETLVELKSRKPCQQCGGFRFKQED